MMACTLTFVFPLLHLARSALPWGRKVWGALVPRRLACSGIKWRCVTGSCKTYVFATILDLL